MSGTINFSIIIPAYNEEELIADTLENLFSFVDEHTEVIVVDNNSTDRTAEIAKTFPVKIVFEGINQISRARNAGAKVARGKYFMFIDADTKPSKELVFKAQQLLENNIQSGGGALISFDEKVNLIADITVGMFNVFSRLSNIAAGCFLFCTKADFAAVGGFSEKVYAGEEIWFSRSLKKLSKKRTQKFKIITEPRIETSARKAKLYTKKKLFFLILSFIFFPFITRYKGFCAFWYDQREK